MILKYLWSFVQSRECSREVKKSVQGGRSGWKRESGVICERRVPKSVKGKVHKTVARPAMLYGLEAVTLTKGQEADQRCCDFRWE